MDKGFSKQERDEEIRRKIEEQMSEEDVFKKVAKKILPEIFLTGTMLDVDDPIMKEEYNSKIQTDLTTKQHV